ncbi:MAG: rhomboid family intramembrane serine protease [Candidatus Krumholzibacteriota bacterium]|nr:rhomboid family intramembrane serine protease [Candidatus Krumholzibacteriota bacterium]
MYFFFYYPIGVETERRGQPWLSWGLMFTLVLTFGALRLFPAALSRVWWWWIYYPQEGLTPGLFLSVFAHAGWAHLLGNLVYLWAFGPSLELALGRGRLLMLWFALGAAGNLAQGVMTALWQPAAAGYGVVGASGALSGLMALFLLRFPYARIRTAWVLFSPLHGYARAGVVPIPSMLAVGVWAALQILMAGASVLGGAACSTAYGAHLGGLLAGLGLGLALGLHREGRRFLRRHRAEERFQRADWYGFYEAVQHFIAGGDTEELSLAARAARLVGQTAQARDLYRRAVRAAWRQGDRLGAAAAYKEALHLFPDLAFPEEMLHGLILALEELGETSAALRAIRIFRALFRTSPRASLLTLRAARLEEPLDPDAARRLYREHRDLYPASPFASVVDGALRRLGEETPVTFFGHLTGAGGTLNGRHVT